MSNGRKLIINPSKEKNAVTISVQDTGVGIPEDIKNKTIHANGNYKSEESRFRIGRC